MKIQEKNNKTLNVANVKLYYIILHYIILLLPQCIIHNMDVEPGISNAKGNNRQLTIIMYFNET